MKIVLTGALGNVGLSTIKALSGKNVRLTCFDIPDSPHFPANRKRARGLKGEVEIFWGDLGNVSLLAKAFEGADAVIHAGAVIPPLSEKFPDYAYKVNVDGTSNVVEAIKKSAKNAKLIFTSSVAVYGDVRGKTPPLIYVNDPVDSKPCDEYTSQKIRCEEIVKNSTLRWTILRLSYVVSVNHMKLDPLMFHVPLDTQMEPVHTEDVGVALANAVLRDDIFGQVFNIAGGKACRTNYRDYLGKMLDIFGIGPLPDEAFSKGPFHMGHMDTERSQNLFRYQKHTLEDIFRETAGKKRLLSFLGRTFRPFAKGYLTSQSQFYKKNRHKHT